MWEEFFIYFIKILNIFDYANTQTLVEHVISRKKKCDLRINPDTANYFSWR